MASISSPSSRFALEEATPEDSAELLEILESCPMPGPISVVYTRRPDAYRSLQREGEPVGILVARDRAGSRVLAMGAFAVRRLYVDGESVQVAYLFALRARGDSLKRWPILHRGYAEIRDRLRDLGITRAITTIVASNQRVAAMLSRGSRHMPAYQSLGRYNVFALLPGRRSARTSTRVAGPEDAGRIADFLNQSGRTQQFFPAVRAEDLLAGHGAPPIGAVRWLEGRPGEVLAVAALWDQSEYRQYRVHRFGRALACMRSLTRVAPFLRLPRLPRPGENLRYATLALWAARDHDPTLLHDLLDGMFEAAAAYPFVLAGAHVEHPLHDVFRRRRHVSYPSEAFRVDWEPNPAPLTDRPLYLECGTL